MPTKLKFLIVDGYAKASRDEFDVAGMKHAWRLYAEMLKRHLPEAEYEVWFPSDIATPPDDLGPEHYAGVLWTGCNLTIYHDEDRVQRQIEYAKRSYEAGTPAFGTCWGLQMAAAAAGGTVEANPRGREMGIARKIHLTEAGQNHPFLAGKPLVYTGFISHVDQVTKLPPGGTLLATNDFTHVQAIAVTQGKGTFWATQYHPEYDLHEVARLFIAREPKLLREGFFESHEALVEHVNKFETLSEAPKRKDLRWQLDIDDDVLDEDLRQAEFHNWIQKLVLPHAAKG
ncbi:MAG: type 1 glutamine amidotransferase [Bryobacteraceae bacterium]